MPDLQRQPRQTADHAIVIGINRYVLEEDGLNALSGAHADAEDFRRWLVDDGPFGGSIPDDHVDLVLGVADGQAVDRPTAVAIDEAFKRVIQRVKASGKQGRRLYVFMSGHGTWNENLRVEDVSFLPATFSEDDTWVIIGHQYIDRLSRKATFAENFLFMDCCRNALPYERNPLTPSFAANTSTPATIRVVGYAAQDGAKARERLFALDGTDVTRGIFTKALLEGLRGGAVDDPGQLTVSGLQRYLRARVPYYRGNDAQIPELSGPPELPITTGTFEQPKTKVTLRFLQAVPASVTISHGFQSRTEAVPAGANSLVLELDALAMHTVSYGATTRALFIAGQEMTHDLG